MTLVQSLLWPASVLYGAGARLRAWAYGRGVLRQRRLSGTVISVGNLTVGGTGKTPMVCWLAERAVAEKMRIGVLTRGYRGTTDSSDEAALLRKRLGESVPVGVGPDRLAKGLELESRGVDWFILDDGFQHYGLARDLDIVLIDASNQFGGGRLLPAGRLREPIAALRRAGIVVITRGSHAPAIESVVRRYSTAPIHYAQTRLEKIEAIGASEASCESAWNSVGWKTTNCFVFCGIGNPKGFLADLGRWGIRVAGSLSFRDHHRYSQHDMDEIERRAREARADSLLCTEKDVFNLGKVRANEFPLMYCMISMAPDEPEQLWQEIKSIAGARRNGGPR